MLAALRGFADAGVWVEVSTLVIPTVNAEPAQLRRIADAVCAVGPDVPWHLGRFSPEYRLRDLPPTPTEALAMGVEVGRAAGLRHVYVERALGAAGRATACAGCGREVVERGIWATTAVHSEGSACPGS